MYLQVVGYNSWSYIIRMRWSRYCFRAGNSSDGNRCTFTRMQWRSVATYKYYKMWIYTAYVWFIYASVHTWATHLVFRRLESGNEITCLFNPTSSCYVYTSLIYYCRLHIVFVIWDRFTNVNQTENTTLKTCPSNHYNHIYIFIYNYRYTVKTKHTLRW